MVPNQQIACEDGDGLAQRYIKMCAEVWLRRGGDPVKFEAACLSYSINKHVDCQGGDVTADFLEGVSDLIRTSLQR